MPWISEKATMLYGADALCEEYRAKRLAAEAAEFVKLKADFDSVRDRIAAKINQQWAKYAILNEARDRGYALQALEDGVDGILMAIHALETAKE